MRRARGPTPRNLGGESDGLLDGVLSGLNGALKSRVGIVAVKVDHWGQRESSQWGRAGRGKGVQLLADVESLGQQLDEAKLDDHIGVGSLLEYRKPSVWLRRASPPAARLTSTNSLTVPEALMVRFLPGTGGSGLISRLLIWITSVGSPAEERRKRSQWGPLSACGGRANSPQSTQSHRVAVCTPPSLVPTCERAPAPQLSALLPAPMMS